MVGIDGATVAAEIRTQLMAFHTQRDLQFLTAAVAIADPHQHRLTPMHLIGLVDPHVLHSHQARWYRDREFAYADELDLRIGRLTAQGGDTDKVSRLRARAAAVRTSVRPLLAAAARNHRGLAARAASPTSRPGGPANSHGSGIPAQEAALRDEWLAANPSEVAEPSARTSPPSMDGDRQAWATHRHFNVLVHRLPSSPPR